MSGVDEFSIPAAWPRISELTRLEHLAFARKLTREPGLEPALVIIPRLPRGMPLLSLARFANENGRFESPGSCFLSTFAERVRQPPNRAEIGLKRSKLTVTKVIAWVARFRFLRRSHVHDIARFRLTTGYTQSKSRAKSSADLHPVEIIDDRSFGITVGDNSRIRGRRSVTSRWSIRPISRDEPVDPSNGRL